MKIEKLGVGWPLLGPAIIYYIFTYQKKGHIKQIKVDDKQLMMLKILSSRRAAVCPVLLHWFEFNRIKPIII